MKRSAWLKASHKVQGCYVVPRGIPVRVRGNCNVMGLRRRSRCVANGSFLVQMNVDNHK